jgi:hypothetical protein
LTLGIIFAKFSISRSLNRGNKEETSRMAKIIVRDLTSVNGQPQINEMVIPNSQRCQVIVVHDDGTETMLYSGTEIEKAMVLCDCPNNRCVKKHQSRKAQD